VTKDFDHPRPPERPAFSAKEKLGEVETELIFRRKVFDGQVERGRMYRETRDKRIALMEAIRDDYARVVAREEQAGRLL